MRVEKVLMTPELAALLLEGNSHNRPLNKNYVSRLEGVMRRGEWKENGETIKVCEDGSLDDGQHRLAAVVGSGITIPTLVAWDVPKEAFTTIDIGRSRTMGNLLAIQGVRNATSVASAANLLFRYRRGQATGRYSDFVTPIPTPEQIFAIMQDFPTLEQAATWAKTAREQIGTGPSSVLTAALLLCEEVAPGVAWGVWDAFATATNQEPGSPMLLARRAIIKGQGRMSLSREHQVRLLALLIKAWNLWGQNEYVQILTWKAGGHEPFPAPLKPEVDSDVPR